MNRIIVFARGVPNKNHHLTPLSAHVLTGSEDATSARDTRPGPPSPRPKGNAGSKTLGSLQEASSCVAVLGRSSSADLEKQ